MESGNVRDRVVDTYPPTGMPAEPYPREDVVVGVGSTGVAARGAPYPALGLAAGEAWVAVRNRVQWGPVLAGMATGLTTLVVLTAFGLAVGVSAMEPGTDVTDWGEAAGIYGVLAVLVSFFAGGWVAAKSAAVRTDLAALLNGFVAGAASLLVLVWVATTGLANMLGFVGANLATIAGLLTDTAGVDGDGATITFADVEQGAWATFAVLVAALIAATLGGWLGRDDVGDLTETTI